jgi:predicted TPR repeat methyltransferase
MDTNLAQLLAIEADVRAGRLAEAAAALSTLTAATPRDPRVHVVAAMLARATGDARAEAGALANAAALAPRAPAIQIEWAQSLSRDGRHADAVAAAERAVALAPQHLPGLRIAIAIASAAGDDAAALRHLQRAQALAPEDASIALALGVALGKQSRYAEAHPHLERAAVGHPDDAYTLVWLGTCLLGIGRRDEALLPLLRADVLLPGNETVAFYLALARGETPPAQPNALTQGLFDDYAGRFDQVLVSQLDYRVPDRVAAILRARPAGRAIALLDLGCGTGLLGACLGRIDGAFVGVDLSPKMLEQAGRHGVYTELRESDLRAELARTPAATFDGVTANDVFIYVGDIAGVIAEAYRVLRPGGVLIFSCETAEESEGALVLRPSRRYAHSMRSVERMCAAAGFESCTLEPIELRLDANVPVAGFIAVAAKAA